MSDNYFEVCGNVTRDPELRFTPSGKAVASFAVAVNRRYQVNGEWKDADATFVNVIAWDRLGENTAASITKGARVRCTGRYEQRTWDKDDGTKGYANELIADDICVSLKWATAEITKIVRTDSRPPVPTDPAAAPARESAMAGGRGGDPIYGDEEPF